MYSGRRAYADGQATYADSGRDQQSGNADLVQPGNTIDLFFFHAKAVTAYAEQAYLSCMTVTRKHQPRLSARSESWHMGIVCYEYGINGSG